MICYLVRHGQDDETVRGGWSDHPLTEAGIHQANRPYSNSEKHRKVNHAEMIALSYQNGAWKELS